MAKNVKVSVVKDKLTIEVDLSKKLGPSASGKTELIATTAGNVEVEGHDGVRLGVNCYRKK